MIEDYPKPRKYFAAANSFGGFISYFDKIFSSKDLSRLYILKGGPGTGKNSFMRKILYKFHGRNYEIEEFYCSSDPSSLDGIIIKHGDARVAVIDGTAPHERDAQIPGAIDKIVNLGENWDEGWLAGNREKILNLNEEKKTAYNTAYEYLRMGKSAFEFTKRIHSAGFDFDKAEDVARDIIKNAVPGKSYAESVRLISAFGKEGLITLNTVEEISCEKIRIGGVHLNAMLFLDAVRNVAKKNNIPIQISPSPLSPELCEAIYFKNEGLGVFISDDTPTVNADDFVDSKSTRALAQISKAKEIIDTSKAEAVRWFKIASDFHFRLEDVYSAAMNFNENERLILKTSEEIKINFDNFK